MADVAPVAGAGAHRLVPSVAGPSRAGPESVDRAPVKDRVEVSAVARYLSMTREVPPIRAELVERIRSEIESGTYETPERIEAAIERMRDELNLV